MTICGPFNPLLNLPLALLITLNLFLFTLLYSLTKSSSLKKCFLVVNSASCNSEDSHSIFFLHLNISKEPNSKSDYEFINSRKCDCMTSLHFYCSLLLLDNLQIIVSLCCYIYYTNEKYHIKCALIRQLNCHCLH